MKKVALITVIILSLALILTACRDKDDNGNDNDDGIKILFEREYFLDGNPNSDFIMLYDDGEFSVCISIDGINNYGAWDFDIRDDLLIVIAFDENDEPHVVAHYTIEDKYTLVHSEGALRFGDYVIHADGATFVAMRD